MNRIYRGFFAETADIELLGEISGNPVEVRFGSGAGRVVILATRTPIRGGP